MKTAPLTRSGWSAARIRPRWLPSENPTITELIDYEAFCGVVSHEAEEAAAGSTVTARELKEMFDRGDDFLLVDVRETGEHDIVRIPGSVLIPKGDLPMSRRMAARTLRPGTPASSARSARCPR